MCKVDCFLKDGQPIAGEMIIKTTFLTGKYLVASLLLFFASGTNANAQKLNPVSFHWDFGVMAATMYNRSHSTFPYTSGGPVVSNSLKAKLNNISGAAGFYADYNINRKWAIRSELQYLTSKFRNDRTVTGTSSQGAGWYSFNYLQTNFTARYSPFWRNRIPLSLILGTAVQFQTGYKDYLLAIIDKNALRSAETWQNAYQPIDTTKPFAVVLGLQIGAAYRYRRFDFQLAYNYTLTPSIQIVPRGNSPLISHYRFSALQFTTYYSILRR